MSLVALPEKSGFQVVVEDYAMITVCIPTFNGEQYIRAQLESILASSLVSEVIISDDGSEDKTVEIIQSFNDLRIKLVDGPHKGLIQNYEFLLSLAAGNYIFLSDQDDIWFPNKVDVMLRSLQDFDLVVSDCLVVDGKLNVLYPSFFMMFDSRPGLIRNLLRNRYLGCCIAFRRSLLKYALPFPAHLPMHDWWLGLIAEIFGRAGFIEQPLVMYRRHGNNASPATEKSRVPISKRLYWRGYLVFALILRKFGLG
jgi:glycosyltransferase involved in cell wall biosynthesis